METKCFFSIIWGVIWRISVISFWFFVANFCLNAGISNIPIFWMITEMTGVAAFFGAVVISINLLKFISAALTDKIVRRLRLEGIAILVIATAMFFFKAYAGGVILLIASLCWFWKASEAHFHNNFPDQG